MEISPEVFWIGLFALLIFVVAKIYGMRTPKEKSFICTKCRKKEDHSTRTIQAWRDGKERYFCRACHQAWIRTKKEPIRKEPIRHKGGGCLSVLFIGFIVSGAITYSLLKA